MKCIKVMTPNPKMCVSDDKLGVAANLMWDYDCGVVPVVISLEIPKLVGMVTDRDIAMHMAKYANALPDQDNVGDCMSTKVITCHPDDLVEAAMNLMSENKIRRIPVVDESGNCVGIVSQTDIISHAEDIGMESVITMLQKISSCQSIDEETAIAKAKDTDKTQS